LSQYKPNILKPGHAQELIAATWTSGSSEAEMRFQGWMLGARRSRVIVLGVSERVLQHKAFFMERLSVKIRDVTMQSSNYVFIVWVGEMSKQNSVVAYNACDWRIDLQA
jgi:hypothetical protein